MPVNQLHISSDNLYLNAKILDLKQTIIFISIIGFLLSSCGTNKEGQLKPASKVYQNTTARYNGYFNGKELFNKSIKSLDDSYQDNYNKILPLYRHVAIENAASVSGDLDNAMEKATVVVNLHPRSYWVDDCYLLLGRSQFLKKEYAAAQHTFEYMLEEFHPEKLPESVIKYGEKYGAKKEKRNREATPKKVKRKSNRKRAISKIEKEKKEANTTVKAKSRKERLKERAKQKKESQKQKKNKLKDKTGGVAGSISREEKKEREQQREEEIEEELEDEVPGYFLKHRPVYAETHLWLAKTYTADKRYSDALFKLSQLENDMYVTEDIMEEIHGVKAYIYLEKGDLDQALESLQLATEFASKKDKARMLFIMGQIYQKQGKNNLASTTFDEVVKLHPNYEMEFNARINAIRSQWGNDPDAQEKTIRLLERMLKDEKNEEFQDQVYFALGEAYMAKGMSAEAKHSFRMAAEKGGGNPLLQTDAYLMLAEFAYELEDYVESAAYYDTTMQFMVNSDLRFDDTRTRKENLRDVADQLLEIQLQDSLMMIAAMTDEEKRIFAFNLKQSDLESQRKSALSQATNQAPKASTSSFGKGRNANFFAYNDKALKKGKKDFNKKWRNRNNEDNWRRSNKLDNSIQENEEVDIDDLRADEMTDEEINEILADVPKNKDEEARSSEKVMRALYLLAGYYDTRIGQIDKSIETYLALLEQFPSSSFTEEAYYALYQAYKRKGEMSKAEAMKNKLAAHNESSKFYKLIIDPDYFKVTSDDEKSTVALYEKAYDKFDAGDIAGAKKDVDFIVGSQSVPPSIKARMALLNALCVGGLEGREDYKTALDGVVRDFPNTDESKRAKEILRYIRGDEEVFVEKKDDAKFEAQKNRLHYLLIVFKNVDPDIKINKLRALVSDYNVNYHKLEKLRVGNVYLSKDDTNPILIVRKFTDAEASLVYYNSIITNKENFMEGFDYDLMVINQRNYREILRSKSLEDYSEFFKDNYLK